MSDFKFWTIFLCREEKSGQQGEGQALLDDCLDGRRQRRVARSRRRHGHHKRLGLQIQVTLKMITCEWGSVSSMWSHWSRMIAHCALHERKIFLSASTIHFSSRISIAIYQFVYVWWILIRYWLIEHLELHCAPSLPPDPVSCMRVPLRLSLGFNSV